jgi:hypothetical protein
MTITFCCTPTDKGSSSKEVRITWPNLPPVSGKTEILTKPACCPSCRHQSHVRSPPRERLLQTGTPPYKFFTLDVKDTVGYCLKRSGGEIKRPTVIVRSDNAFMRVQIFRNLSGRLLINAQRILFSKILVREKTNRTSKFFRNYIDYCTEPEFLNF